VRLQEQDGPRVGWDNPAQAALRPWNALVNFIDMTLIIAELEVRKLRHDPTELVTRAIQPVLWLMVFGQVFTRTRAIRRGIIEAGQDTDAADFGRPHGHDD